MTRINLTSEWQLCPVETFPSCADDSSDWRSMTVPSHWQQHPQLENYSGKMVYRTTFPLRRKKGSTYRLELPGTFYWSTVFLNGQRLGAHEGYFAPQRYDVTELLESKNELVVHVDCPDEKAKNNKRMITGVFSHWDCLDPETNPGGIWLAPTLRESRGAFIDEALIHTERLDESSAEVRTRLTISSHLEVSATLKISFKPATFRGKTSRFEQSIGLRPGTASLELHHELPDPRPWWTHDLGSPDLYDVEILLRNEKGRTIDRWQETIGVRTIEVRDWIFYLNGVKLFIKGNNYPPTDTRIATTTREQVEQDLSLAIDCHMNMLRVHAHVAHPELYSAADRLGVLLWQDFPLQWSYQREILPIARGQIKAMVRLLYNHPSIAMWCCHNEPIFLVDTKHEDLVNMSRTAFSIFVWSWNRNVLDVALQEAVEQTDGSRFVTRCSGDPGVVRKGGDTHFYFGWYRAEGKMRNFDHVAKYTPHNLRMLSEFGAQSFPNLENAVKFMDTDIEKIDWGQLEARHSLQTELMRHWIGLDHGSLEALIEASQSYQSLLNRYYIDRIRRHKYQPAGGMLPFMFTDSNPAIQWSILDYWRTPKASFHAMRKAFSPQYAFVLLDRDTYRTNDVIRIPVFVVNDARERFDRALVRFSLEADDGTLFLERTFTFPLPADSTAIRVAGLEARLENPGTCRVNLILEVNDVTLENVYSFEVVAKDR